MKKFKWIILIFAFVPCMFLLTACNLFTERYVVDIKLSSQSTEMMEVYTITYSDGTTSSFTVENGEDGKDLDIEDIYNVAKENGYTGTFLEFLDDYLNVESSQNMVSAVNKSLLSSVIVTCEFPVNSGSGYLKSKDIAVGAGSGVIYKLDKENGDAYIITNYHVVYNSSSNTANKISSKIKCYLYGADTSRGYKVNDSDEKVLDSNGYPIVEYGDGAIDCEYIGGAMTQDIAVLKVSGSELLKNSQAKEVEVANSDNIQVGSRAIAIGNPEGSGFSVTDGVVSVDSEELTMKGADDVTDVTFRVMRIDTAVNGGNSGGGLYNNDGELIGIVNAKIIKEEIENIGYAIPSNVAIAVADNILRNATSSVQSPKKATIGITITPKNSKSVYDQDTDTIKIVEDVSILEITEGSLASNSSLNVGDIIKSVTIRGTKHEITRTFQLVDLVWTLDVGDVLYFEIEGKTQPVIVSILANSISAVK